jgi:hypothetical protein
MRLALILLSLLVLPLPTLAQEAPARAATPASPAGLGAEEIDKWRQTLLESRERVDGAREQFAVAQQAYRDARKRKRRGAERAELLAAQGAAEQELAEAEAELRALLEEARREGVPPGVLREFED